MLSLIPLNGSFKEIDNAYKKFKQNIFNKLYEAGDTSFQTYETNLINSINIVLRKSHESIKISDENLMRALIGTRTLSKFSILHQKKCVEFYSTINSNFPRSIQMRRFFIKSVVKEYKNKENYAWDNFTNNFYNEILPTNPITQNHNEFIIKALIYIEYLIKYNPDFVCKLSSEIIFHLNQIIQMGNYTLDLNYDIINYTNQTTDTYFSKTNVNPYYSNFAIELLRKIFSEIKLFNFQTIEITQLFEWHSKIKSLATLSTLFEKCPKWFFTKNLDQIGEFLHSINDSDREIQCLLTRNRIFYSIIDGKEEKFTFSINNDDKENVICGMIQNIKLVMEKKLIQMTNIDDQMIFNLISRCFESDNKILRMNGFDLLNSCLLYNSKNHENFFKICPSLIECIKPFDIEFGFFEVIKFLKKIDTNLFTEKIVSSIQKRPIETLQFLSEKIQDESMKDFLTLNETVIEAVFDLTSQNDCDIKSLSILVASQLAPEKFFCQKFIKNLFHYLLCCQFKKVKLTILQCLNNHLDHFSEEIKDKFADCNVLIVLKNLLNQNSMQEIQLETIKLVCKLKRIKSLKLEEVVKPYLSFFLPFSDIKDKTFQNYIISPHQLSISANFLPIIFDSFPQFIPDYFQAFYNFSMDFMNMLLNSGDDFTRHSKLNLNKLNEKMYFQRNFFRTIFCSYSHSLEIILGKDPEIMKPYFDEIINFCYKCLLNGIGQLETQSILSLLKNVLLQIELKQIISNDKRKSVNDLFTVVYNTGSRFMCPIVHQNVFEILGYLGAQQLFEKQKPLYKNLNEKNKLDIDLQKELIEYGKYKSQDNIYYVVCSNSLLNILDDESMSHSHFHALCSLVNLIGKTPFHSHLCEYFKEHFVKSLKYLKKLINKSGNKSRYIPLIQSMLTFNRNIINENVNDFVQLFIDLWYFGSIDFLPSLVKSFNVKLKPFANKIIPYIRTLNDIDVVINSLFSLLLHCFKFDTGQDPCQYNLIVILTRIANKGNYQVIPLINNNLLKIRNLPPYVRLFADLCIRYLRENNGNLCYLDDTAKLLGKLTKKCDFLMEEFVPLIRDLLQPFEKQLDIFNKLCPIKSDGNDNLNCLEPVQGSNSLTKIRAKEGIKFGMCDNAEMNTSNKNKVKIRSNSDPSSIMSNKNGVRFSSNSNETTNISDANFSSDNDSSVNISSSSSCSINFISIKETFANTSSNAQFDAISDSSSNSSSIKFSVIKDAPSNANNKGGVKFGSNNGAPTNANNKGGVTFGSNNCAPTNANNKGGVTFGSNNGAPTNANNKGGVTFGSNNDAPSNSNNKGGVTFGSNNDAPTNANNKGGVTFGLNNGAPTNANNKGGVKFGSNNGAPTNANNKGGVTFGSNNDAPTNANNKGGVTFGSNNDAPTNANNKGGVTFGSNNDAPSNSNNKGGVKFGSNNDAPSNSNNKGGVKFGSNNDAPSNSNNKGGVKFGSNNGAPSNANNKGGVKFGSNNGAPSNSNNKGGVKFGSNNDAPTNANNKGGVTFGSNNDAPTNANNKGGVKFGSNNDAPSNSNNKGGVKFGSNNDAPSNSNNKGGVKFGSNNGAPTNANNKGGVKFGSNNGAPSNSNNKGGVKFGSNNGAPTNANNKDGIKFHTINDAPANQNSKSGIKYSESSNHPSKPKDNSGIRFGFSDDSSNNARLANNLRLANFDSIPRPPIINDVVVTFIPSQTQKFMQLITDINNHIQNEISTMYIDLWLNNLIQFCIKNSPSQLIKSCFPIARNNVIFATSIFNVAFHSILSSNYEIDKNLIASTFLNVLDSEYTSHYCHTIITDLIEFMDRDNNPLLKLEDVKRPLTSIFSSKPPISLRYAILKFENNEKPELQKTLLNDLEQAFLNCGLIDQFQQYSRIYDTQNANNFIRYQVPIFANSFEDRDKLEKIDLNINDVDTLTKVVDQFHLKIISHLYKAKFLTQRYLKSNPKDEKIKDEIKKEINLGFESLSTEGGPHFSQGFTSVLQYIIYGQQLIELNEMVSSENEGNNFHLRFINSSNIISFLPQILLLRTSTKDDDKDSLIEKVNLLSLCRRCNRWSLMEMYFNFFNFSNENVPVEIQYEMMYCKINNNTTNESEIDNLITLIKEGNTNNLDELGSGYKPENLLKFAKYQKAMFIARTNTKDQSQLMNILSLCDSFDNADAIDLCGLSNLRLFEVNNDKSRLNESIKNYIKSSIKSDKVRISNMLLIIYLLFTYYNNDSDDINDIKQYLNDIPLYFYVDLMSQMISYIADLKNNSFKQYIISLLSEIMIYYPQGVIYDYSFSIFSDRRMEGITDIIESPITEIMTSAFDLNIINIFSEAISLTVNLINVNTATPIGDERDNLFSLSPKLAENRDMLLPVFGTYHYNDDVIFIHEFSPKYEEINSLEKPKRISIIGSDGHEYPFIMKEKEDLRTDQRIMIFHKFLNQYLKTKVRTYSIVPLTSNQGLIQSVQEMIGIHQLIQFYRKKVAPKDVDFEFNYLSENLYKTRDTFMNSYDLLNQLQRLEFFKLVTNNIDRRNDLRDCFWFFTTNSENWFKFITNFTSTCAVTSMISYIIGLGDRHLRNIMISKDNGVLMNIDFCDVFEMAQIRPDVPEKVPFRLTRNMVEALGPCGFNGSFRVFCEETLFLMRENRENIKNILKVFVDSPIQKENTSIFESLIRSPYELVEAKQIANQRLKRINKKLDGTDVYIIYQNDDDIDGIQNVKQMSVREHVQKLIEFATDESNLCCLYSDWEPWK